MPSVGPESQLSLPRWPRLRWESASACRSDRSWSSLGFVPLIVFIVGGVLLSTQVSNSHGFEGGDWSDAAAAALAGVLVGGMASIAFLATFLARTPLRTLVAGR